MCLESKSLNAYDKSAKKAHRKEGFGGDYHQPIGPRQPFLRWANCVGSLSHPNGADDYREQSRSQREIEPESGNRDRAQQVGDECEQPREQQTVRSRPRPS